MNLVYLILLFPFFSFAIISLITLRFKRLSSYISILAIFSSLCLSCKIALLFFNNPSPINLTLPWFITGETQVSLGAIIDPLSIIILIVVSLVSLLIQIYSRGYMQGDPGFSRYYAFLSLFSFSMLLLVLSNNFVQMFISWELVGVCSYLLIGFWYHKESAASAGKKAFITTRIGDVGFLIGILLIFKLCGTFDFKEISSIIGKGLISSPVLTLICILVFCGAIGKSAQFPLHVWLPDAMEGPSPVSALIHAATMVAAGVYLVARLFGIFFLSCSAMDTIAIIGGFTAIFSATIAIAQNDIKRIIAYSTLSQLGYMMLALGCGGYTAGTFHLTTHAFFKALLFLCAGSVIHSIHSNNIWDSGGLFKKMPITGITFLCGGLALSGIPPLSGFFSKEMILSVVYEKSFFLFSLAIFTVFLTSLYTFRLFFVVFCGSEKGHSHESPLTMTIPMIILAILSVISGFFEKKFSSFIEGSHHSETSMLITIISVAFAFFGIFISWAIYGKKLVSNREITQRFSMISNLLTNKYWVDEIYRKSIIALTKAISTLSGWFDLYIIDGMTNATGFLTIGSGRILRFIQTGLIQSYILFASLGIIFLIFFFL
ncbi:MAG: NADH-quinone oxidoreductase subunit L [bacterium]